MCVCVCVSMCVCASEYVCVCICVNLCVCHMYVRERDGESLCVLLREESIIDAMMTLIIGKERERATMTTSTSTSISFVLPMSTMSCLWINDEESNNIII